MELPTPVVLGCHALLITEYIEDGGHTKNLVFGLKSDIF